MINNRPSFIPDKEESAFTLVELLVVIAIIAILMTMLMPALKKASEQVKRANCYNNEKHIGLALAQYLNDFDEFLPPENTEYGTDEYLRLSPYIANAREIFTGCLVKDKCRGNTYGYNRRYLGMFGPVWGGAPRVGFIKLRDIAKPSATITFADSHGNHDGYYSRYIENAYPGWGYTREYLLANCTWMALVAWRHNNGAATLLLDGHTEFHLWYSLYDSIELWDRK